MAFKNSSEQQKYYADITQYQNVSHLNEKFYKKTKRLLDIIFSMLGIIVLIPVFTILSLLIKASEPRQKVIFLQERVGKNGKKFIMYKFRTMNVDAEKNLASLLELNEVEGAMFKISHDPRVTKFGKVIRKYSLDELPQLFNVLKGEMSLVGPRPPLTREVDEYSHYDKQRLQVIPGCTGLWQVSGRNNVSFKEMVELDLFYIEQKNLMFDLIIIYKTVEVMIRPNGAS